MTIKILENSCIFCGRCVKVCPSEIFQQQPKEIPTLSNINSCIKCGHCVAICPADAIEHELFPPEKVHTIDYSSLPSADQLMGLMKARRSQRVFTKEPVPEELLSQIVEAAHRAPTASNSQKVYFKVITDPHQLKEISSFTVKSFKKVVTILTLPIIKSFIKWLFPDMVRYIPSFTKMEEEYKAGKDIILRDAKALIFIYTPKTQSFGSADANLAYQNGSLMAEVLGVGHFYTGFVVSALRLDRRGKFAKTIGIKGKIHAGMALGMPQFQYPNYIDRKSVLG